MLIGNLNYLLAACPPGTTQYRQRCYYITDSPGRHHHQYFLCQDMEWMGGGRKVKVDTKDIANQLGKIVRAYHG